MTDGTLRRIHHTGVIGLAAAIVTVLALHIVWPQPGEEDYWPWALGLMAFPVTSALILIKRPGNGVGRALGIVAMSTLLIFLPWWLVVAFPDSFLSPYAELVNEVAVVPQFAGMAVLVHVFPTGRPLDRWFGRFLRSYVIVIAAAVLVLVISPASMTVTGRPNPLGVGPQWGRPLAYGLWLVAFAVSGVIGIVSLIIRRHRAGFEERAQLRWFLAAAVVSASMIVLMALLSDSDTTGPQAILWGVVVSAGLFWSLPGAVAVAVLRYRLYEIDRIISRTVSYAVVVAFLALLFFGVVTALSSLLPGESDLAIAGSTLAVAALFNPVRRRVQGWVDRRFNRSRYDTQRVMDRFAGSLKDRVDSQEVVDGWVGVVSETMQPASVAVWVRDDRGSRNVFGTPNG